MKPENSNAADFTLAHPYFQAPFKHKYGMIVDKDYNRMLDVRGWGHLTGSGAHGLSVDDAAPNQDQIGDSVAKLINENWKLVAPLPADFTAYRDAVGEALAAWDARRTSNHMVDVASALAAAMAKLRALHN